MRVIKRASVDQVWYLIHSNIVSEYDQEISHSQTTDKPVSSWGRDTQKSRDARKSNKAKQPALSSPLRWLDWTRRRWRNTSRTSLVSMTSLMSLSDHGLSLVAFKEGPLLLLFLRLTQDLLLYCVCWNKIELDPSSHLGSHTQQVITQCLTL